MLAILVLLLFGRAGERSLGISGRDEWGIKSQQFGLYPRSAPQVFLMGFGSNAVSATATKSGSWPVDSNVVSVWGVPHLRLGAGELAQDVGRRD